MHVEQRDALAEFFESRIERQSQIVLLERPPELARKRLRELTMNHFERYGESMAGAHRAGHELQTLRKDLLELVQPHRSLALDKDQRQYAERGAYQECEMPKNVRKQEIAEGVAANEERQAAVHSARYVPAQAGLLDKLAKLIVPLELFQHVHDKFAAHVLVGREESRTELSRFLARFLDAASDDASLELV